MGGKAGNVMDHHDRLLPGENPDTNHVEDAELWLGVYAELIAVKERLLVSLHGEMQDVTDEAKDELERVDEAILKDQVAHFMRRHAFWQARLKELAAVPLRDAPG